MNRFFLIFLCCALLSNPINAADLPDDHTASRSRSYYSVKPDSFWLQSYYTMRSIRESDLTPEGFLALFKRIQQRYFRKNNSQNKHLIESQWNMATTVFALKKLVPHHLGQEKEIYDKIVEGMTDFGLRYKGFPSFPVLSENYSEADFLSRLHTANNLDYLFSNLICNPEKLIFLRTLISPNCITEAEWVSIVSFAEKMCELEHARKEASYTPPTEDEEVAELSTTHYFIQDIRNSWPTALQKFQTHYKKDDAVVSVGNTPAYLTALLERHDQANGTKTVEKIITVAISGHPGIPKHTVYWLSDVITPEGLANYRQYLESIGFYNLVHTKGQIWFTDIVSQGGGIAFLVNELYRHALEVGLNIESKVHVMALNETTQLNFYGIVVNPDRFLPLNLSCASTLDQCNNSWRMVKSFPAHKWRDDLSRTAKIPYTKGAEKVLDILKAEGVI